MICTDERFVNIDKGRRGGTQWTCFYIKTFADSLNHACSAKKSFYFESFERAPAIFILKQLPEKNNLSQL